MESLLIRHGIAVQPELDSDMAPTGAWSAYIRSNLFNEDGSEAFCIGATPLDAVEKTAQTYLMFSGIVLL